QQESAPSAEPNILWQDEFHGATLMRNSNRIASWVWAAGQRPNGLCVPANRSDMAEWQHNLSGELSTTNIPVPTIVSNGHDVFDDGFVNYGCVDWTEQAPLGEGEMEDVFARHGIVFAALPDNKTVVCLQYAETTRRIYLQYIKGLGLKMPNDLFNDFKRKYASEEGCIELSGCPAAEEIIKIKSSWLNIDDCLSVFTVYGDDYFTIYRPAERQIKIKYQQALASLYADEICSTFSADRNIEPPNKIVIDTGVVLVTGIDAVEAKKLSKQQRWHSVDMGTGIRAVRVADINNQQYLLIANFSNESKEVYLTNLHTETAHGNKLPMNPFTGCLLKIMSRTIKLKK
ncbi:MAG: hypothetical protein WC071_09345, partial [Victivallaceae bacterium]